MSDMFENICENNGSVEKCSWVPFFRQLLICNAVWTIYFTLGMTSGAPTIFIPQIRKQMNSTNSVSDEMESWLSSVIGYGGIPWVFILPLFTEFFGRKIPFIILCVNSLVAYIVFYCSKNTTMVLISEIMQGMAQTGAHSILPVIITEYTSIKYRGIFLTLKSASFFWGVWAANAIGTFYHWKVIGLLGLTCCIYLITVIMWPESPYWLATKGRYEECKTSYHWLKGYDHESDKELKYLLNSQIEYRKEHEKADTNLKKRFKKFLKTILSQDFYKPMLLCILMMSLVHLSGKLAFSMYATQVIKKITQNEATAYRGMLVLDGFTVLSMYVGCLLANFLKRRTQLLVASLLGVMFLLIMYLYLYLIKLTIIIENAIVSILLLILFSVTISCGPIIMSTSIYGELVPLRFKSSGMFVMGLFSDALMAIVLKVSPYIFESYGIHNACLIFAISAALCILLLYKYLPETKDKSLEEIEHYFNNEPLESIEECKDLVTDVDNGNFKALL